MSVQQSRRGAQPVPSVRLSAPAKINPYLQVLGRRSDGFHSLDTTMLALDLRDEIKIELTRGAGLSLCVEGPAASADIPNDARNLVWKAAQLALDEKLATNAVGGEPGLALTLIKRIPSQAGLGGGSADAAATLIGCNRLLALGLSKEAMGMRLATLGSDCAFFAEADMTGFARCQGRGELVEPLTPIDAAWNFVVIVPELECPTSVVYSALERTLSGDSDSSSVPFTRFTDSESRIRNQLFNRLEAAAMVAIPQLQVWRSFLDDECAAQGPHDCGAQATASSKTSHRKPPTEHFRLSGSGSAFFGVYRHEGQAREALGGILQGARERGLPMRGGWLLHPNGRGASFL